MTAGSSDRELVERVTPSGDEEAFRLLYRRHTDVLYAVALRMTAEHADAEDVVHDAWVRAADALGRFEWRSTLRTWLIGIVVNRVRELNRRDRRDGPREDMQATPQEPLASSSIVDFIDLDRAIMGVPDTGGSLGPLRGSGRRRP